MQEVLLLSNTARDSGQGVGCGETVHCGFFLRLDTQVPILSNTKKQNSLFSHSWSFVQKWRYEVQIEI